jgi:hypothetical protein
MVSRFTHVPLTAREQIGVVISVVACTARPRCSARRGHRRRVSDRDLARRVRRRRVRRIKLGAVTGAGPAWGIAAGSCSRRVTFSRRWPCPAASATSRF